MNPDKPLRIAVIGTRGMPCNYSGIERASESLYTRLAARGHQVTVYCRPEYMSAKVEQYHGIRLIRIPTVKQRSIDSVFHSLASTFRASLVERYDVIHFHALAAGLFTQIPRLRKVPTVVTIHGLDWQRAKWKGLGASVLRKGEKCIARHSSEIIAISRDLQRYFADEYGLEVSYIPNGIEHSIPNLDRSILDAFHLVPGKFITFVGRLVPEKRIEDLILAFRQLRTAHKLAIVGEGGYTNPYVDELRSIAGADPRIVFTGLLKGTALAAIYESAAAFVLPSDLEGLPMSLLEAMERGIPAIVSDIPPHRELLGSVEGYDLFVPCRDISGITDRLSRLIKFHEHYTEVAKHAQTFVRNFYSWDASANSTEELLQRVVSDASDGTLNNMRRNSGSPHHTPKSQCATTAETPLPGAVCGVGTESVPLPNETSCKAFIID